MAAKAHLSDELRSVVQTINAERLKDSEWEAAFDRHLKTNRNKRVAPISRRVHLGPLDTASEEVPHTPAAPSASNAAAAPAIPPTTPQDVAALLLPPEPKKIPTGPSLLQRLGTLSSVSPAKKTIVERAGLPLDTRLAPPPPPPRSQDEPNGGGGGSSSSSSSRHVHRPRDVWEAPPRGSSSRSQDAPGGGGGDGGSSSSRHVHRPRDTWEAPPRADRRDRDREARDPTRCDTYFPPSSPFVSDPMLSHSQSSSSRLPPRPSLSSSLEDDRESVSSSHYYSSHHRRTPTYGGPLPSPPPQQLSGLAPPPPARPSMEANGSLLLAPFSLSSEQSADHPYPTPKLEPPPPVVEEQEDLFPLPHELPFDPEDRNYIAWPPPSVAAASGGGEEKGGSKEREAAVRFAPRPGSASADALETAPVIKDPRLKLVAEGRYGLRGRRKLVTQLNIFKWERDAHSAGPLPPMAVAVGWQDNTWHFSEILKFFQPFGRIEATEAELDKDIGTRMPFLWIKFAHDYDARGHIKPNLNPGRAPQDAIKIVPKVVKELDGFRLPGKVEVRMSVRADAERRRYRAAYEAELQRRRAERAGPSAASDSTKSVAAQTPMRSAVGHAGASPSRSRIDGGATATSRSPMSTRDEHVHAHAHGSNGRYAPEGSARRTNSFSRPQADSTAAAAAAAAESHLRNGNGSAAQAGPDRPARWLMNGHGAAADPYASREFTGIPKAPKTTRWSDASSHEVEGRKTGKAALPPPPPSLPPRVGRLGGIAPGGPVNTTTNLSTEEIHRRLSILGRSYFRWPKGPRKLKFSEIKGLFHGNANIDLLEQDEAYFYCCLKSELLTMQHHRTPVRSLRGMDCITLQLCPPLDPRAYGGSHETGHGYGHGIGNGPNGVGVGNAASQQQQQMAMRHLTDALVNSAKHHADQQQQQQMENHLLRHSSHHHHHHQVTAAAPAVVDAMAVLANSTSSIPSAPASTRGMPLPSIRRREHIPEEEVREDEEYVSRPSKIRKVSGGGGRTREGAREYHQEYRGSSLEPHGRGGAGGGAVKGSSPSLPLAQATPTESTRMGDSDEDDDDGVGGGIKDDDTQTTEEMVEERSSAAGEDEKKRNAGGGAGPIHARGVKRALRQIFSSDEEEEDGGSAEEGDDGDASSDSADDEDDDVSSVEKTLLSFKASPPPRKKKQQQRQQQQRQQQLPVEVDTEEDDALASMLLETVASIEPVQVHDVALQDLLESVGSKGMPHSARKPAKATAKANKKAKIAATVAAKKPKGKPPTKSSRPEPIRTVPAPAPEPEVAIVVRQPEESYTPTESIPPTPTEANAAGPKALPRKADPRTKKGRRERARSPSPDPFALSLAENEEDLYFLRLACERLRDGLGVAEEDVPEGEDGVIPAHSSGAARTEGYYKIPASQKAAHLPDRNKAIVEETTGAALRQVGTARGNRAESRRVLMNIELHKKESATDTDMLKFNQLSARKKQLRFAKSPIHDWGLYAMEQIPAGDMVIEYVGEVIRQQVADEREKRYERQGQFSTYLFRVDDELVVDATMKGNIARLMNHCCTPNCTAKILTVNGEKRIALFAKSTILPGQELTYDYKFQSTGDDADQISCLCGSPQCRKFL